MTPSPDDLVEIYGRVRRADKERLEEWATRAGVTTSVGLRMALPHGVEWLEEWAKQSMYHRCPEPGPHPPHGVCPGVLEFPYPTPPTTFG